MFCDNLNFAKKNDKVYVNTGSCNIGILHYLHFEWLMKMLAPAMRKRSILEIHNITGWQDLAGFRRGQTWPSMVKRVITIFATNASFLRVISNF